MPVAEADRLFAGLVDEFGVRPTARLELLQGRARLALMLGDVARAESLLDLADELAADIGRRQRWRARDIRARLLAQMGRNEEARSAFAGLAESWEREGYTAYGALARAHLAIVAVRLGDVVAAGRTAAAALDVARSVGDYESTVMAGVAMSAVQLAAGEIDEAVSLARTAVDVASAGDWVVLVADARLAFARALAAAGQPDQAGEQTSLAERLYAGKGHAVGAGRR